MTKAKQNYSLKNNNTLQVEVKANYFAQVKSEQDILDLLSQNQYKNLPKFVLGSGSNTLFTKDYQGLVIHNKILGREITQQDQNHVYIKLGGGEDWPQFVEFAVNQGYSGVENLALIPGTAGAAPVQNIAAYGHNLTDTFVSLEAINLNTLATKTFNKKECKFGYRDSVFKNEYKGQYIITRVTLKLNKKHNLETNYYSIHGRYDSLQSELKSFAQKPYTIKDVYQAVINIRTRKLPDWTHTPTVGSFFVNPIITKQKLTQLQSLIQELQFYPAQDLKYVNQNDPGSNQLVKIPVGRLLDELGWKGKQIGNCNVSNKWASIITHNGKATGQEILEFTQKIKTDVKNNYGITIKTEVEVV